MEWVWSGFGVSDRLWFGSNDREVRHGYVCKMPRLRPPDHPVSPCRYQKNTPKYGTWVHKSSLFQAATPILYNPLYTCPLQVISRMQVCLLSFFHTWP